MSSKTPNSFLAHAAETALEAKKELNIIDTSRLRRMSGGLTFDMSGGPKGAKRPLERPLDGGVRPRRVWGERLHSFHSLAPRGFAPHITVPPDLRRSSHD